ncbi:hypothetical protein [Pseudonocardia oceani]|uniref:hypothetical protein n=1 Tax=Pseudonocardia oceani TaxID=2792013 RepID=UPI001C4A1D17|nr:hypothetical protein [Pseudonocardia oceani]
MNEWLAAWAVRRAHVLVVEVPGWWTSRVAVERAVTARGWRTALSPADADVLVVCGVPGPRLAAAVDRVWDQLPGPRARTAVTGTDATGALDEVAARLQDDRRQRADARDRPDRTARPDDEPDDEMAPAGIPLAGGADDRDGLEMDVLQVPLGPVLPHWPAGLVLHCALHGDVVAGARTEVLDAGPLPRPPRAGTAASRTVAARCDGAARLLALAGWDAAADDARHARDLLLDDAAGAGAALGAVRARVRRSRVLRRQLSGLGPLDEGALRTHGLPPAAGGDVRDRLLVMLDPARGTAVPPDPGAVLAALPVLVRGLELGAARLVVAGLAPDTAAAVHRERAHA